MSTLSHPNIILFMGIYVDEKNRYIMTELMPKGSVFDLIHTRFPHPDNIVSLII
jgi:serine/threonine protein kinase